MKAKKILLTLLLAVTVVALCAFSLSVEVKADLTQKCETITVDRYAHPYPESSHGYGNNLNQYKTFTYPGASQLTVTFSGNTKVEEKYDYIYLFDGNGTLLASYTGTAAANQSVTVFGDSFTVRLTSDRSMTYYGYSFSSIVAETHNWVEEGDVTGRCTQHGEIIFISCADCDHLKWTDTAPLGHTTTNGVCQRCNTNIVAGSQVSASGADELHWALDDQGTLTVFGMGGASGYAYYYDVMSAPWYIHKDQIKQVIIEDGISNIGAYWFAGCRSLTRVAIADSVTYIGDGAFQNCSLYSFTIPASVTYIGHNVFYGSNLRTVYYGGSSNQWSHIQFGSNPELRIVLMEYNHVHSYAPNYVEQPTCTSIGFTEYTCVYGDGYRIAIPALGHNYVGMPAVEPTCTTAGAKDDGIWCERCGTVSKMPTAIPALGHNFTNYVSDNNATYDADGTKTAKCDRCDETNTVIDVGSKLIRNGWFKLDGQWYYFKNDVKQSGWLHIGNIWYYLQSDGAMATGWQKINKVWYYLNQDGVMQIGWQEIGNTWYYLDNGVMLTGAITIGGKLNVFDGNGKWLGAAASNGWSALGGNWYYCQKGVVVTGWKNIGGAYYYFNNAGVMQSGWLKSGNAWYYLNNSGIMATGWQKIGAAWYYFQSNGAMATGWQKIGAAWYYFQSSGAMATGWQKVGAAWYYFQSGGAMATGWQKIGAAWYYFQSGGAMQTGWMKQGSTWYYFNGGGAMATGSLKIGGKTYRFNSSGACLNP